MTNYFTVLFPQTVYFLLYRLPVGLCFRQGKSFLKIFSRLIDVVVFVKFAEESIIEMVVGQV